MKRAAAVLLSGLLLVAGCGGDENGKGDPAAPPGPGVGPAAPDPEAFRKFERCLRDNGVDPPQPGEGGFQPPSRAVMDRCRQHLPGGGEGPVQAPLPQSPGP